MSLRSGKSWLPGGLAITALAIVLPGCGKPSYCSKVSDLQALGPADQAHRSADHGLDLGRPHRQPHRENTNAAITAAKSDFPQETQALSSSYATLKGTVTQVSARTSRANLTTLAVQATAFANAVDDFKTATNSKCS